MHVTKRRRLLVLAAWPLALPALASAEPPTTERVLVRAAEIDFASLAPLTRGVMRHELASLLAPASLGLSWRRTPPHGETDADELRVVLMRTAGRGTDRGALGSARARGPAAATVWVYVPTVAAALDLELEGLATSLDAQRRMGLALARVLVHEVVHALAPHVDHARAGLMRPSLHPAQLEAGRAALEGDCVTALASGARDWLARAPLPAASPTAAKMERPLRPRPPPVP
jgi:hypothetical protein